jgi:hypothetical protein
VYRQPACQSQLVSVAGGQRKKTGMGIDKNARLPALVRNITHYKSGFIVDGRFFNRF